MAKTKEQRERRYRERCENRIRNTNIIYYIKQNTPCSICGQYCFTFYLDCHHFRGEKINNVSNLRNRTKTAFLRELRKCAIVCYRCHVLIHQDKIKPILQPISIRLGELK